MKGMKTLEVNPRHPLIEQLRVKVLTHTHLCYWSKEKKACRAAQREAAVIEQMSFQVAGTPAAADVVRWLFVESACPPRDKQLAFH